VETFNMELWTTIFCTAHLCLGYFAGRAGRPRPTPPDNSLEATGMMPKLNQFAQAYATAQPMLSQLPDEFQRAIEELAHAVKRMAKDLNATSPVDPPNTRESRLAMDQAIAARLDKCHASGEAEKGTELCGTIRRGYKVPEYIAPYQDDWSAIPHLERVLCHDISATGISFFRDRPLDYGDAMIITLSQPTGTIFMVATVQYSRPIIVRGEDRYRIGCRFDRRLGAPTSPLATVDGRLLS
jgi:hypothetical protein